MCNWLKYKTKQFIVNSKLKSHMHMFQIFLNSFLFWNFFSLDRILQNRRFVVPGCHTLSVQILPIPPIASSCTITYSWCCQDTDPSIRLMPSGLLQLPVVWYPWQPHQDAAVTPESCYTPDCWCQMMWSYHTSSATAVILAASQATGRL